MSTFNKYRLKGAYHWDWYETEDWYKYLVDRCVKFCNGKTIDIGCGDGLLVSKLQQKGLEVEGVDPNIDGIRLAQERCTAPFMLDSVYNLVGEWEYMTCLNVIEHLDNPDFLKDFVKDNITKGAIIITNNYKGGSLGEDHKFEWTYDEMMDFFKEFNPKGFRYKDTEWIGVEITK